MCLASTTSTITVKNIAKDSEKTLPELDGTASTKKACTSLGWSTLQIFRRAAWVLLARNNSTGLKKDVKSLSTSTPIVLFAHIPLWAVYPQWGWGTDDAERALSFVKRFGSVTVLNGHIHQVMQKVEGNVTFHTARGTAFPLPTPGSVPKPIPVVVEATQLKKMLGLTSVNYTETNHTLAVVDSTLE
jgi:3',5'-cyclic-AMP phosphodiesterase